MLVSAHDLVKTYVMGDEIVRALDGVRFDIPKGDYVSIIGAFVAFRVVTALMA